MNKFEIVLRDWSINDIENIIKYANNKNIANNLRNAFPHPYTRDDAELFVKMCINSDDSKQYIRAITLRNNAIGSIGVFRKDDVYCKSAEIGYWLGEEFWGKGIMTKAIKQICTLAFKKYDIERIFAEPFATNQGSKKVLEKAGFELEGIKKRSIFKNGVISDSCMYALLKDNFCY